MNKKNKAYTLLEVLIATGIIAAYSILIYKIDRASYNNVSDSYTYVNVSYIAFGASNLLSGYSKAQLDSITDPKTILTPMNVSSDVLNSLTITINSTTRTLTFNYGGEIIKCIIP